MQDRVDADNDIEYRIRKGKPLVAVDSLECDHVREAARHGLPLCMFDA